MALVRSPMRQGAGAIYPRLMFDRIVVGYGGDEAGRDAVALAGRLHAALGGVVSIAFPYRPLLASEGAEEVERRVRAQLGELAGAAFARATCHWSPASWPIHALHELAAHEQAQLIVFGAAREGLREHLHVALMERMVHGAPCAVAVAPAGYARSAPRAPERVGVGFADSPEGAEAMALAHALAKAIGGELELIAGCGLGPELTAYAGRAGSQGEVEGDLQAEAEGRLREAAGRLGEDVPVSRQAIRGEPAGVLVSRSAELDLLVLGSRSYGPLRHVMLGSVSADVMREAACPVVVVPRGVHGAAADPV